MTELVVTAPPARLLVATGLLSQLRRGAVFYTTLAPHCGPVTGPCVLLGPADAGYEVAILGVRRAYTFADCLVAEVRVRVDRLP